jgi:hypothetical protein
VAVRGMSTSATAFLTAAVRATVVLFGWCVSDSVFPFCLVMANTAGRPQGYAPTSSDLL